MMNVLIIRGSSPYILIEAASFLFGAEVMFQNFRTQFLMV
jgi:hypothetical protein